MVPSQPGVVVAENVIHVIAPGLPLGGAEAVVEALASAGRSHTRVIVLSQISGADAEPHPFFTRLQGRSIDVREIRCGRRRYAAEVRALEKELGARGADVIHTHGYHADLVGYFATRRLGLPIVSTVHGYIRRSLKEHLYNVVDRFVLRRFDGVIGVAPAIVSDLVRGGIAADKVHLVPNGLNAPTRLLSRSEARSLLGLAQEGPAIGWIGRLSSEKGPDLLLAAVAAGDVHAQIVLIGEGPELPRLKTLIQTFASDLQNRIRLVGYRADAGGLLAAFDVLALTSRSEGTPMVILEAVDSGVPIVAFGVGGIPALLTLETAWLVPAGDVKAMGEALRQAVTMEKEARAKAALARSRLASALSIEGWLQRTSSVYQKVLAAAQTTTSGKSFVI